MTEERWCPLARNSESYMIAGQIPFPVVVNRNDDGTFPEWARCIGPMCMWWRSEGKDEWCGVAGRPE